MNKKLLKLFAWLFMSTSIIAQSSIQSLFDAVRTGDYNAVKNILENNKNNPSFDINYQEKSGSTLLFNAIGTQKIDTIKLLLDHGANPNIRSNSLQAKGETPFYETIFPWMNKEIALLLLEHGADPNIPDKNGYTPLFWAAYYARPTLVELLLKYHADPFLKHKADKDSHNKELHIEESAYDKTVRDLNNTDHDEARYQRMIDIKNMFDTYPHGKHMQKTTAPGSRGEKLTNVRFGFK